MKEVILYVDENGRCQIEEYYNVYFLKNNKDCSLNREKLIDYLNLLAIEGVKIGYPYVRYLGSKIWELRPLNNRILFFETDEVYVMLSAFRKETNKTPKREILKAKKYMNDYLNRRKS